MAELTPFPDGTGYMENAWNGMSAAQWTVLVSANDKGRIVGAWKATRAVLVRQALLDDTGAITGRGRDLVAWVRREFGNA